jgi:peptidoglycan/LPS O-acetylase OafA/YrhL
MSATTHHKLPHLEGLRGIAAFVVGIHHFAAGFYPALIFGGASIAHTRFEKLIYGTPLYLPFAGNFAVCIFFVLSGYVLSYQFFKHFQFRIIRSLAVRRYPRLVIPVFGSVLIAYLFLQFHLFFGAKVADTTLSHVWLGNYWTWVIPNADHMIHEGLISVFTSDQGSNYNHVLWTMYYEFLGSFLVFGSLAVFIKFKKRFLVYALLTLFFWKTYFLGFILGMLLADYGKKYMRSAFYVVFLGLGLFLGTYPMFVTDGTIYQFLPLPTLTQTEDMIFFHTLGACLLLQAVLHLDKLKALLSQKLFVFLGYISFSFYLFNAIFIFSYASFLFYLLPADMDYTVRFLITFVLTMTVLTIFAYLYTYFVDTFAIKFARAFDKALFEKEPVLLPQETMQPAPAVVSE